MFHEGYHRLGTEPSVIRELFAYGLQKKAEIGADKVFDYTLGNPSIPSPAAVNLAVHKLTDTADPLQLHGYSMAQGFADVRDTVARSLSARFEDDIRAEHLFFTCGAAPAVVSVLKALAFSPDAEIVLIAPYFPEYAVFAKEAGAKIRIVPADIPKFQIDLDALEDAIGAQTQAVIVNSPNNPSGAVYTEETLSALAAVLSAKSKEYGHPVYLISDEPYRELVYDGKTVRYVPRFYPDTIVCYSYSKSLSLPGERLGYIQVTDRVTDARDVYAAIAGAARAAGHVCAPTLMQRVIAACADEMPDLKAYDENRTLLYNELKAIGYEAVPPDGAFYLFVKAPGGDAMAFTEKAKTEHVLLVVPGDTFGCPGYLRLAYCVAHDMIERSIPAFRAMMDSCR